MWFLVIKRVHFSQLKLVAKNDHNDHHDHGRFQAKFDPHGRHWSHWSPDPLPPCVGMLSNAEVIQPLPESLPHRFPPSPASILASLPPLHLCLYASLLASYLPFSHPESLVPSLPPCLYPCRAESSLLHSLPIVK